MNKRKLILVLTFLFFLANVAEALNINSAQSKYSPGEGVTIAPDIIYNFTTYTNQSSYWGPYIYTLFANYPNWNTAFGWGDHSLAGYLTTRWQQGTPNWLYNDSTHLYFNETILNETIDGRAVAGATDTRVQGDFIYLYNDSTDMSLNETKLNMTTQNWTEAKGYVGTSGYYNPFDQNLNTTDNATFQNLTVHIMESTNTTTRNINISSEELDWWTTINGYPDFVSGQGDFIFYNFDRSKWIGLTPDNGILTPGFSCWNGTNGICQFVSEIEIDQNLTVGGNITSGGRICDSVGCIEVGGTDTRVQGDGLYLYNDSDNMTLNETKLNMTVQNWTEGKGYVTSSFNPFNQSLNTTDNVAFNNLNTTGNCSIGEGTIIPDNVNGNKFRIYRNASEGNRFISMFIGDDTQVYWSNSEDSSKGIRIGTSSDYISFNPDLYGDNIARIFTYGNVNKLLFNTGGIKMNSSLEIRDNLTVGGNITLGQTITFSLGEMIDNIVDGWIKLTGNFNVTGISQFNDNVTIQNMTIYENASDVIITTFGKNICIGNCT